MGWSEALIAVGVLILLIGGAFAVFLLVKVNGQDAIDPCLVNDDAHQRLCDQIAIMEIVNLVDDFAHCKIIDHQNMPPGMGMEMNETMKMLEIANATSTSCQNVIHWFIGQNWTMVPENTSKVFLVK